MGVFRCDRCDQFVDIDLVEYFTIPAPPPSEEELEICGNCIEDDEMPCECGEAHCDECRESGEGEPAIEENR